MNYLRCNNTTIKSFFYTSIGLLFNALLLYCKNEVLTLGTVKKKKKFRKEYLNIIYSSSRINKRKGMAINGIHQLIFES